MKRLKLVAGAAALMLLGVSCFVVAAQDGPRLETLVISSKNGQHRFEVEIAATPVALEIGLMLREKMEENHGMLFQLGRTDVTRFWMKNTLIPLDMLFIAPDGTIKKIHGSAAPKSLESISSEVPVSAVLEINGGRSLALGIAAGDKVVHPYFENADADTP